ncbi:MAG: D-alanyl-D-alanine carboxypeptidase/D-alanyl-D-alanine-endopeptidase [Acidobacteria bacterium]|nr:D-alanyl-D-alanine carboxypeptidase/D-alanyl-D-alanine-endopeptidase [Acidobacteriota bacterium]
MKNELQPTRIAVLFAALLFLSIHTQITFGQDTGRTRVIISEKSSLPNPTPTPIGAQNSVSAPDFARIQSYVTSKVNGVLLNPLLKRGRIGVRIDMLDSNATVFSRDADEYFMPASNMKSYSVAAAIDTLSPNFRFVTSVYSNAKPDETGTLRGDLIVYGRGDPSISTSFYDSDYFGGIDALAEKIARSGVKKIEGNLIGDETYFNDDPIPTGWEWDDLQWYYGAEISSLTINDNAVDLKILPTSAGAMCSASISPPNSIYKIVNNCQTTARGSKRKIRVTKKLDENLVVISGTMPEGDSGFSGSVTISRPAKLFVELLRQRLQLKGITISGASRAINLEERNGTKLDTSSLVEITRHESPPLSVIAAKTMKPSQNLYTELILRALGEERGDRSDPEKTSVQKGIEIVESLLRKAGADPESIVQYDGSGLSRHNLITPSSAVKLYEYMDRSPNALFWRNALTIGGIDGTLRNRFKGTSAEGNVRGKTGTIDQVSALSGYVTAKSGERFVFSILTNSIPNSRLRVNAIDEIVLSLANYDSAETAK